MILIVGLGNPGEKFKKTRHNLGRLVVNTWQLIAGFSGFRFEKKSNALISKGVLDKKQIILALPETFMNNSGKSVKMLTKSYKLKPNNLIIVHDDIDLPIGKIRISKNRGSAGHKGVESIIKELGTKNFTRVRIGICPQDFKPKDVDKTSTRAKLGAGLVLHRNKISGAGFVLQRFNKEEEKVVQEIIKKSCLAIEMIVEEGIEKASQQYNQ